MSKPSRSRREEAAADCRGAGSPSSPWREPPFTSLPNAYLRRLAASDLSASEIKALLVILTETVGQPGLHRGVYGRERNAISGREIGEAMDVHRSTAHRAVSGLISKGWVDKTTDGSGRAANVLTPRVTPRTKPRLVEPPEEASEGAVTVEVGLQMVRDFLAEKQEERRR